jgi:hypothetical protein
MPDSPTTTPDPEEEVTETTEPELPTSTTTLEKKGGLPVPPEPSIPPPRY